MTRCFLLLCGLCLLSTSSAQQNILVIIADDLGKDYCGFYEEAKDTAKMPNVRSLLSRGVRFTNAWATPYCSPTRAGMLTGRYSFRTGVGTVIAGAGSAQLDTAEKTIPKLLRTHAPVDYATANIGKWHLHRQTPSTLNYPNVMGYDWYEGNFLGELSNYYNWTKVKNGQSSTVTNYATSETVDNAIAWLKSNSPAQPFFLWLAFNAPHSPFHEPPDALHTVPGLTGTTGHIQQNPKLYFRAMIEAMDTELGRLFQWLKTEGKWDNTTIVFIGDNGNARRVAQNGDTSKVKGTLYEYGINTPFLVAGKSVSAPGRVSDALVSTPDLFATVLELAGAANWPASIPADKPVDAKSIVPILKNEADAVRQWNFTEIFTPTPTANDGKTMRNAGWKLIHFADGRQELYHLAVDPGENTDLLKSPPLSAAAAFNYVWLCTEMGKLLGTTICKASVNTETLSEEEPLFEVFPNPSGSGEFRIRLSETALNSFVSISVEDISGKSVFYSKSKPDSEEIVATGGLNAGVYFIRLITEKGRGEAKKVVVLK